MNIPFFNYKAIYATHRDDFIKIFDDVASRGAFILQEDLRQFEEDLKTFLGVKYAYGVADGTNALMLGLRACGVCQGDEVIVPAHTYVASVASIHYCGATPVLADIGYDGMICATSIESLITDKTKAIMPVQLNGRTANMEAIFKVAHKHDLLVVEDSAQALGSKFKDTAAGTFGSFGTYSFYPAKTLGCFGDGGAIVTNDDKVAEAISLLRDHGRNSEGEMVAWGTNSRLDNLQAAILQYKLKLYPEDIMRRREIAELYNGKLSGIIGLTLPPAPSAGDHYDIYQNYEIQSERRDDLRCYLAEKGVGTIIQWGGTPVHRIEALGLQGNLPKTDDYFAKCFLLPIYPALKDLEVNYICDLVCQFYESSKQNIAV